MTEDELSVLLVIWIIIVIAGTLIGSSKNRGGLGFILTFFLGLIGLIIIAAIGSNNPTVAISQINPTPAPNPPSNLDMLERLGEMYQKGILTKKEFDAKKKELL